MDRLLPMWVIYDHPSDHPDSFVARLWLVDGAKIRVTDEMFVANTLEEVRDLLPGDLACIPRYPNDDKVILEVWL